MSGLRKARRPVPVQCQDQDLELSYENESLRSGSTRRRLSTTAVGPDAGRIAEEVVSHLDGLLVGSDVTVTPEIEVTVPTGVPEHVERVVTENSSSLRLDSHAFEDS